MSRLLIEELLEEGRKVLVDIRNVLATSPDGRVRQFAGRVPRPSDDLWRLVATGEYNAGKSTLLRALTGDPDIRIDADVATDRATEYHWNQILLVDTPGVGAGRVVHDERAEVAVRAADLVLFVLTVALFDDITARHFRHVAIDLGKLQHMIVVINKSTQMAAAPGVRLAAVQESLGQHHQLPPVVECDGLSMLRAELGTEEELREFEELRSGRAALVEALDAFVRAGGSAGRVARPFEAALAAVSDVRPFLVPDETEQAMQKLVSRRREALALSRQRLMDALDKVYADVIDSITGAGERVIASARDGIPQAEAVEQFDREAQAAAEGMNSKIKDVFSRELIDLQADEKAIAAGPEVRILEAFDLGERNGKMSFDSRPGPDAVSPSARMVQGYLANRGKAWLKDAIEGGSRPGSPTHSVVTGLGHSLGHKFRPWQAVQWAKNLNFAVQAAMAVYDFYRQFDAARREEQRDRASLLALRRQIKNAADTLIQQAREEVDPLVNLFYSEAMTSVEELEGQVRQLAVDRETLARRLLDIERRSREALSRADGTRHVAVIE